MKPPAETTDSVTLYVSGYGDVPFSYFVTFEGPAAEALALSYVNARPDTYFSETPLRPFSGEAFPQLAAKLYPTCEHGMSAWNCYGSSHYVRDDELAAGW